MKKYLLPSLKLTVALLVLSAVIYPTMIALVARMAPGAGNGEKLMVDGKVVGYANVGQRFTQDKYFWGRPSAIDYNAAGSAGSNKGPSNSDYLAIVAARTDSFLAHNPGIKKSDIPAELVTASGSGLDPHISPPSARVQIKRVAAARHMNEALLEALVEQHTQKPLAGLFGPATINVLQLNIALDKLK